MTILTTQQIFLLSAAYSASTFYLRQFPYQLLSYFFQCSYLLGPLHLLTALLFKCASKHVLVRLFQPLIKDTCVCTEFVVYLGPIWLHSTSKEQRKLDLVFITDINVFHPLGRIFYSCSPGLRIWVLFFLKQCISIFLYLDIYTSLMSKCDIFIESQNVLSLEGTHKYH